MSHWRNILGQLPLFGIVCLVIGVPAAFFFRRTTAGYGGDFGCAAILIFSVGVFMADTSRKAREAIQRHMNWISPDSLVSLLQSLSSEAQELAAMIINSPVSDDGVYVAVKEYASDKFDESGKHIVPSKEKIDEIVKLGELTRQYRPKVFERIRQDVVRAHSGPGGCCGPDSECS